MKLRTLFIKNNVHYFTLLAACDKPSNWMTFSLCKPISSFTMETEIVFYTAFEPSDE